MVFYRKYRPQTLSELDNSSVAQTLARYMSQEVFPHAFLFTGPKGTGKTSTARILAKSINCLNKKNGAACGECDICYSIAAGTALDVLEIDAASNRGIDEIRALRETIKLSPTQFSFKVYIIDEVHMLTSEAFNALLKTLEEPPTHAVFILATTETHKIPDTILSRCVHIIFHKASAQDMLHALKRIVDGEMLSISDELLSHIAEAADGSFRDGAKLLEEVASFGKEINQEQVDRAIGLVNRSQLNLFLEKLKAKDAKSLFTQIEEMENQGKNMRTFFQTILHSLHKDLLSFVENPAESGWNQKELTKLLSLFNHAFSQIRMSVIPTLPFELAIVEFCEMPITPKIVVNTQKTVVADQPMTQTLTASDSQIEIVTQKWPEVIDFVKKTNNSLAGVLRSTRPIHTEGTTLTIETKFKFHADRLSTTASKTELAKAIESVLGSKLTVSVVLKSQT